MTQWLNWTETLVEEVQRVPTGPCPCDEQFLAVLWLPTWTVHTGTDWRCRLVRLYLWGVIWFQGNTLSGPWESSVLYVPVQWSGMISHFRELSMGILCACLVLSSPNVRLRCPCCSGWDLAPSIVSWRADRLELNPGKASPQAWLHVLLWSRAQRDCRAATHELRNPLPGTSGLSLAHLWWHGLPGFLTPGVCFVIAVYSVAPVSPCWGQWCPHRLPTTLPSQHPPRDSPWSPGPASVATGNISWLQGCWQDWDPSGRSFLEGEEGPGLHNLFDEPQGPKGWAEVGGVQRKWWVIFSPCGRRHWPFISHLRIWTLGWGPSSWNVFRFQEIHLTIYILHTFF